jgi:hypothetical protein
MEPKTLSDMNPEERTAAEAERPEAVEVDTLPMFTPGVILFEDGLYRAVSPDIETVWPWIDSRMASLLRMLPMQHRAEYWRERIECGATLALAFFDSKDTSRATMVCGAGMLNCELSDDGKRLVSVMVCTVDQLNLEHAARIAESTALAMGAEQVCLWTPVAVPIVAGYRIENCWFGQLQMIDIEPIQ